MVEIILGYIPEAIYFALFMIYTKQLKEKRLLYIGLMILEYLLLKQFIHYSIYFQVAYTFLTFIILKILYKDKSQIIDIFTFTIGSIYLILTSALFSIPKLIWNLDYTICVILNRIFVFTSIILVRDKLHNIQNIYKKLWNRNDKVKKKIKSTTFRSLNVVIFNTIFFIINAGMIFAIFYNNQ